jgi:hypothetical protein
MYVIIAWDLTDSRGSPITQYSIKIMESDSITYTSSLETCDGT